MELNEVKADKETADKEKAEKEKAEKTNRVIGRALATYLLIVAGLASWGLVQIFPQTQTSISNAGTGSTGQAITTLVFGKITLFGWQIPAREESGLILLALLSGTLGSFLHAGQSLASYIGNKQFENSWFWWYVLRPPMGAVLGVLFYFVIQAGLTSTPQTVSPYRVVALAGLAGWFSKQATDKLAEIFDSVFKTEKKPERKHKLEGAEPPTITNVEPNPIPIATPAKEVPIKIAGTRFVQGAKVSLGGVTLPSVLQSEGELSATIPAALLPTAGTDLDLIVTNPDAQAAPSLPFKIHFR